LRPAYPLEQAAAAHRLLEPGHVRGKIVLKAELLDGEADGPATAQGARAAASRRCSASINEPSGASVLLPEQ
jgi:hypothetical protein